MHTIEQRPADALISLFDRLDAWRKPERVNQLALCSEADARGRGGLANMPYPQGNYLRRAFALAQAVSSKAVVEAGFKGIEVREELTRRRIEAVEQGLA
jgi:tRNA nucleotidyltransferase (CCA-adding enzyme)